MKVFSVVGNRPQFIKSGPVSLALRAAGVDEVVLHTGQHWDAEMSAVFFDELELPEPAYRSTCTPPTLERCEPAIGGAVERERPDWVLVYGDTNSTLAGANAAAAVPVAHVEAGLRSGDLEMPEERNRIAVDRLAALLLPPDERSARDAPRRGRRRSDRGRGRRDGRRVLSLRPDCARALADPGAARARARQAYVVATIHREANVRPERLRAIAAAIDAIDEPVAFPIHPRTRRTLAELGTTLGGHVHLTEPVGYLDMAALSSQARVIVTDSGGLQKEAYWYAVPCVTVRPSTEWVDTVELGANVLVEPDPIPAAVRTASLPGRAAAALRRRPRGRTRRAGLSGLTLPGRGV